MDYKHCAGQKGGIEAAIHAIKEIYSEKKYEGLLMVEASNAFNSLNCKVAMKNLSSFVLTCHNTLRTPIKMQLRA